MSSLRIGPPFPPTCSNNTGAIAQMKRLCERYAADPEFRRSIRGDAPAAGAACTLGIDCEEVRPIWDIAWQSTHPDAPVSQLVQLYREFSAWREQLRDAFRECSTPQDERFARWRQRQVQRLDGQLKGGSGKQMNHAPFCFELSKGCSVGCPFCAVDAEKLTAVFPYTHATRELWRDVLTVAGEVAGPAARCSFCYWATDPFDNPDYEKFCLDFEEILGMFPTTTTALALKEPERTRAFVKIAREHGCPMVRFSVLTAKSMERIHQTFTAEELLWTQCLAMNPESEIVKTNAGRFRKHASADPSLLEKERQKLERLLRFAPSDLAESYAAPSSLAETIACVTGFLVNMVERTVRLVSPCPASARWPLGYMVFDEERFADGPDFHRVVERMISQQMTGGLDKSRVVRFRADIEYQATAGGFELVAPSRTLRFDNPEWGPYLRNVGEAIQRGSQTIEALAVTSRFSTGVAEETTLATLDELLSLGVLDEEPHSAEARA